MQNMVISNYTGRYTTIHRRKRPSDKRKPPNDQPRGTQQNTFFEAATLLLRSKYENPNPDRVMHHLKRLQTHLTKPEGYSCQTTGPPKHRIAHLKKRKVKQYAGAVSNTDATDIGKGNTKGYLLRLCSRFSFLCLG